MFIFVLYIGLNYLYYIIHLLLPVMIKKTPPAPKEKYFRFESLEIFFSLFDNYVGEKNLPSDEKSITEMRLISIVHSN